MKDLILNDKLKYEAIERERKHDDNMKYMDIHHGKIKIS